MAKSKKHRAVSFAAKTNAWTTLGIALTPTLIAVEEGVKQKSFRTFGRDMVKFYTGINFEDGSFNSGDLAIGLGTAVGAIVKHKLIGKVAQMTGKAAKF